MTVVTERIKPTVMPHQLVHQPLWKKVLKRCEVGELGVILVFVFYVMAPRSSSCRCSVCCRRRAHGRLRVRSEREHRSHALLARRLDVCDRGRRQHLSWCSLCPVLLLGDRHPDPLPARPYQAVFSVVMSGRALTHDLP